MSGSAKERLSLIGVTLIDCGSMSEIGMLRHL